MFKRTGFIFFLILLITCSVVKAQDEKVVNDITYKFTVTFPAGWEMKDMKETTDKDAISYSFESKDKKMTVMLLAFKLNSIKNIDDFIYNLEKDISLNIPAKDGDYSSEDFGNYDMKSGHYKDNKFDETIYYFRTKLQDAPNNYVYMLRFISEVKDMTSDREAEIKKAAGTFKSTAE